MLVRLPPGTLLYRVTETSRNWADVISGNGAYFSSGGRYNRVQQRTVYASRSPLVAIAEVAAHQALDGWQPRIGLGTLSSQSPLPPPQLPLVSEHFLWSFRLDADCELVDLDDSQAQTTFGHSFYELRNPSQSHYERTARVADLVRRHRGTRATVEGIIAPSVRCSSTNAGLPQQIVLFVPPSNLIQASLTGQWKLELEFRDSRGQSIVSRSRDIDWSRPWFRLSNPSPPAPRPRSPNRLNVWHQFDVKYA